MSPNLDGQTYADNVYYREYQNLLVAIHLLIARGENKSPDAQKLRYRMEQIEPHISDDEMVRLNELSADLAIIHGREVTDPDVVQHVAVAELPALIALAFNHRKWEEFLTLLRAGVQGLWSADQLAYVRSRAYEGLGESAPAVAFMDEAARREPNNSNYRALALRLLWNDKQYAEAYSRAAGYLADQTTKPRLVLMSGGIVAQETLHLPPPADLSRVAVMAVDRMQQVIALETSQNLVYASRVALGLLSVHLDDANAASDAFRQAMELETASGKQVISRWLLSRELTMIQDGKAKTADERANARNLAQAIYPLTFAAAA